jgi:hypothetical protein
LDTFGTDEVPNMVIRIGGVGEARRDGPQDSGFPAN